MTLLRTTPSDREPPWGKRYPIEDVFDLPGKGTVVSVAGWAPEGSCTVRLWLAGEPVEAVVRVGHYVGDHRQVTLLFDGLSVADLPRGTELEFISPS